MKEFKEHIWFKENDTLLWTTERSSYRKNLLSEVLNVHWTLDKFDSVEFLRFMCWEDYVKMILDFKNSVKNSWKNWLALDIDETLSATSTYWFSRLLELFWNPENLTPDQMVKKYYHTQNVPYWKGNEKVLAWMHEHREDDEIQKMLELIEWTDHHYREIHENIIPVNSYITARPDNVVNWTKHWLKQKDFPNNDTVILRPQALDHSLSNLWKACVLDILYPEVVWIVDDNPGLIKLLPERYKWHIFLYDKPGCDFNHVNIYVCQTIEDVRNSIEVVFK